ncbi:unnamed protein product [Didymodactylos carnosus]|uniref:protein acetyllysine N-acetyltransferase n=1 Tax=Didymodactylos carnosus TaxID=1234261 RepID=A0A814J1M0_9BILA|nr:unnamed protein product [Didymodactylos carnosus]CAF1177727.1 unnamed protein product [Didymodactylos carnosus]CAF3800906.1 unnamed protein product [Didymodactylos carnosus]CAF3988990.1 unnamed protein product [Didymodactylos carnosus]
MSTFALDTLSTNRISSTIETYICQQDVITPTVTNTYTARTTVALEENKLSSEIDPVLVTTRDDSDEHSNCSEHSVEIPEPSCSLRLNRSTEIPEPPSLYPNKQDLIMHDDREENTDFSDASSSSSSSDTMSDNEDEDELEKISLEWIQEQVRAGADPKTLLMKLMPGLPEDISQDVISELLCELLIPVQQRQRLEQYQTLDDAVNLLRSCENIIVLTGAGISVSCGIPDFRSRSGIYARLKQQFPELPDPQAMFDMEYFTHDPRPFFQFAKEIYPGEREASLVHWFIKQLETDNRLKCRKQVNKSHIKDKILDKQIPYCEQCNVEEAIYKPDIIFFGEPLGKEFHTKICDDREKCDLLIVIGSSLKVKPVSLVTEMLPSHVPQILINRETLSHKNFDIELLGNCDTIINELCLRLSQYDKSYSQIKKLQKTNLLNEVLYQAYVKPLKTNKRKKQKVSSAYSSIEIPVVIHQKNDLTSSLPPLSVTTEQTNVHSSNAELTTETDIVDSSRMLNENDTQTRLKSLRQRPTKRTVLVTTESCTSNTNNPRKRTNLAVKRYWSAPHNSYVFCAPNRYVFDGADILLSDDEQEEENQDDNQSL